MVFLSGEAQEQQQIAWAGNLARNAQGVVAVVNNIGFADSSPWDLSPTYQQLQGMAAATFRALPVALLAIALLLLAWLLAGLASRVTDHVLERRLRTPLLRDMVARASAAVVFILGLYIVLRIAGLTSLAVTVVGGTGLLGLAIGFAFRDIAENFLASILISMQRPFAVGDFVNTRATLIMTRDGNHVQIPNAIIYKNEIINFTANPHTRQEFTVSIAYDDTMAAAQTAALEVLRQHPAVMDEPEPLVLVDELAASTVNLRVSYWVDTATYDARKVRSAVIRQVKTAFDLAGISMPSEAREITFPEGVQVALAEPSAPTTTAPAPEPLQPPPSAAVGEAHLAEGGLKNSDDDIEKQARAARLPEGGENLL